jgi:uncharacterized protein
MEKILGDYEHFIREVENLLIELGIKRHDIAMIDHLCYRVETIDRYQEVACELQKWGKNIGEVVIGGRPISTYELNDSINVGSWSVPYIELPAPKEGSFYSEGLEHAELVVVGSLKKFKAKYGALPFESPSIPKKINPELSIKGKPVTLKFHELQLGAVVRIEELLKII